jgi:hypothetical protein
MRSLHFVLLLVLVAGMVVGTGPALVAAVEEERFCVTVRSDEPVTGDLLEAVEAGKASITIEDAAACAEPAPSLVPSPLADGTSVSGTAPQLLDLLSIETVEPEGYDRDLFEHWTDADADDCNTRKEVLIAESLTPVSVGSGCSLAEGTWSSAFDGQESSVAGDFDIDHLVPLAEAWRSGARDWTDDRRTSYANDLDDDRSLIAVSDNSNSAKGDKDPAVWLPPDAGYHCRYVSDWVAVKTRWDLSVDQDELDAIHDVLADCPADTLVVVVAR